MSVVLVTAASVRDRDAARPLLWNLRKVVPSVRLAWADGGYAGKEASCCHVDQAGCSRPEPRPAP